MKCGMDFLLLHQKALVGESYNINHRPNVDAGHLYKKKSTGGHNRAYKFYMVLKNPNE